MQTTGSYAMEWGMSNHPFVTIHILTADFYTVTQSTLTTRIRDPTSQVNNRKSLYEL